LQEEVTTKEKINTKLK